MHCDEFFDDIFHVAHLFSTVFVNLLWQMLQSPISGETIEILYGTCQQIWDWRERVSLLLWDGLHKDDGMKRSKFRTKVLHSIYKKSVLFKIPKVVVSQVISIRLTCMKNLSKDLSFRVLRVVGGNLFHRVYFSFMSLIAEVKWQWNHVRWYLKARNRANASTLHLEMHESRFSTEKKHPYILSFSILAYDVFYALRGNRFEFKLKTSSSSRRGKPV